MIFHRKNGDVTDDKDTYNLMCCFDKNRICGIDCAGFVYQPKLKNSSFPALVVLKCMPQERIIEVEEKD